MFQTGIFELIYVVHTDPEIVTAKVISALKKPYERFYFAYEIHR